MSSCEQQIPLTTQRTRRAWERRLRPVETRASTDGEFSHIRVGEWNALLETSNIEGLLTRKTRAEAPGRPPMSYSCRYTVDVTRDLNPDELAGKSRIVHVNGTGPISVKTLAGVEILL